MALATVVAAGFGSLSGQAASAQTAGEGEPIFFGFTELTGVYGVCIDGVETLRFETLEGIAFIRVSPDVVPSVEVPEGPEGALYAPNSLQGTAMDLVDGNPAVVAYDLTEVCEVPDPDVVLTSKKECFSGGWATSTSPVFTNQGRCVSFFQANERANKAVPVTQGCYNGTPSTGVGSSRSLRFVDGYVQLYEELDCVDPSARYFVLSAPSGDAAAAACAEWWATQGLTGSEYNNALQPAVTPSWPAADLWICYNLRGY